MRTAVLPFALALSACVTSTAPEERPATARAALVSVESLRHDSPFADYRAFDTPDPPDWIGANRRVHELGGWQAYAREIYRANKVREEAEAGDAPDGAPGEADAGVEP